MSEATRIASFGATGTGKTAWVLQQIAAMTPARLMVWDFKSDHMLNGLGQGFASWPEFVKACTKQKFTARYLVNQDLDLAQQFDAFCALAWREGNLMMFVDELAEVTKANKAPANWRKCINVGRSYENGTKSISIIGASQRPSEVDKSFIGNCDVLHFGRIGNIAEAKAFSRQLGCDDKELSTLPNLQWIEKRSNSHELTRGVLSFGNKKPVTLNKKAASKTGT
jgi:hypothetical protein